MSVKKTLWAKLYILQSYSGVFWIIIGKYMKTRDSRNNMKNDEKWNNNNKKKFTDKMWSEKCIAIIFVICQKWYKMKKCGSSWKKKGEKLWYNVKIYMNCRWRTLLKYLLGLLCDVYLKLWKDLLLEYQTIIFKFNLFLL